MPFEFLRHRAELNAHRERFLMEHAPAIALFDALDARLPQLASALEQSALPGAKSTIQLAPFVGLMHRHARDAFESIMCYQSHQAWTIIRPFVQVPLIVGKWLDHPQNAVIWMSRKSGKAARKEYKEAYSGDSLKPQSLPNSEPIRNLYLRLDDDFLLTNPRRYTRPIALGPGGARPAPPPGAPEDDADHRAHLCAFLHMAWFVAHSTGKMLAARFGDRPEFRVEIARAQRELRPDACAIAAASDVHRDVLVNLGLWPHDLLHPPANREP